MAQSPLDTTLEQFFGPVAICSSAELKSTHPEVVGVGEIVDEREGVLDRDMETVGVAVADEVAPVEHMPQVKGHI